MLAVWLPVTSHCWLEQIPGLSFLVCCDHGDTAPHQDSDCDTDGCASVENGFYKIEDAKVIALLPACVLVLHLTLLMEQSPPEISSGFLPTVAPPELGKTWQFSYRAAAPPRAPSLAS